MDLYLSLAAELLGPDCCPLLLPPESTHNIGGLSDKKDAQLCAVVCDRTSGMDAVTWQGLSEDRRIPWMEQARAWQPAEAKPTSETETDYVLVSELWPHRLEFKRHSDVTKFLKRTPNKPAPEGIRNRQNGQRRFVHVADWHRFFKEKDRQAFESMNGAAALIRGVDSREAEIRKERQQQ